MKEMKEIAKVSENKSISQKKTQETYGIRIFKYTHSSHCSHHSAFSLAFSLTEVWYFSFPSPIVTKASLVPFFPLMFRPLAFLTENLKKKKYSFYFAIEGKQKCAETYPGPECASGSTSLLPLLCFYLVLLLSREGHVTHAWKRKEERTRKGSFH